MEKEKKVKEARMRALKDMKKKMKDVMSGDLAEKLPMKVTVASDSKEGMEDGLSKAQEILKKKMDFDKEMGADPSPKMAAESKKKKK